MYSKQSAFSLPGAILLLEIFRIGLNKANLKAKLIRGLPFLFVAALVPLTVFCFVDVEHRDNVVQHGLLPSYWLHAWTEIGVLKKYLALLIWPIGQNIDHDALIHPYFWDAEILFSLGLHTALISTAVRCRKKNAAISFGILFFYLGLFVESFLVELPDRIGGAPALPSLRRDISRVCWMGSRSGAGMGAGISRPARRQARCVVFASSSRPASGDSHACAKRDMA